MAGKIEGATGNMYGVKGSAKRIPTAMWETNSPETGGPPETKGREGAMLKAELAKSKGTGLKVP